MATVRRKCFISYHHADQDAVNRFIRDFDHDADCFIARGLGEEMSPDIIQSTDTSYVMRRIRERFLKELNGNYRVAWSMYLGTTLC